MTAQIFDLIAERAKRAAPSKEPCGPAQWRLSKRGNPYTMIDGYHIVLFKRSGSWSFRIDQISAEVEWYSERHYATEDTARSDALLAVRQLGRFPRQA